MFAIKKLSPCLYGSEFTIYTDHKPLKSLFVNQNRNLKVQRWSIALAEMGAKIKYGEGKTNTRADTLSRLKPEKPSENTSEEQPMRPDYDDEILQAYLEISGMVTSNIQDLRLEDNCLKTVMEIHREGDPGIPWDFDDLEVDQVKQEQ